MTAARMFAPRVRERLRVTGAQAVLAAALLGIWEYLPKVNGLADKYHLLNPFFISSPSRVVRRIGELLAGTDTIQNIREPLWFTVRDALIGLLIGVVVGAVLGLLLSSSPTAAAIIRPFVVVFSAVPRIALIPVIVVVFGPTSKSSIFSAALIVFFAVFFNAFEGGRTVKTELLDNVYVLGAPARHEMFRVRLPYVLAWTVVALPGAAGYGLVGAVVTEVLVGIQGMGQQLVLSLNGADATTTIALAVLLAALGIVLTGIATFVRSRLLFWWEGGAS